MWFLVKKYKTIVQETEFVILEGNFFEYTKRKQQTIKIC